MSCTKKSQPKTTTHNILDSAIRKYKAEIKELFTYKKKIQKVFKAKTLKTALKHFKELKEKLEKLLEVIKEFIKKIDKKLIEC